MDSISNGLSVPATDALVPIDCSVVELPVSDLLGDSDMNTRSLRASKVLGWPKICKLAQTFLWEYSYKRLKLAQLLGQLGACLTCVGMPSGSAMKGIRQIRIMTAATCARDWGRRECYPDARHIFDRDPQQ